MADYFVKVSEHPTVDDFVPFTTRRFTKPGPVESWRTYGPYTERGAERIARRALSQVGDMEDVTTYPSGARYVRDCLGTRVVTITSVPTGHVPWGEHPIRNFPK